MRILTPSTTQPRASNLEQPFSGISDGREDSSPVLDALAILVPMLLFLEIALIGRLFASEVLLVAFLPLLFRSAKRERNWPHLPKWVFVLGLGWLAGQVITDVIRETDFLDYSRGWSKIVFTLSNFAAIFLLIAGSRRRTLLFAFGLAVGLTLKFGYNPDTYASIDAWKFGLAWPVCLGLIIFVCSHRISQYTLLASGTMLGASALNLFLGFRSMASFFLLIALYLVAQRLFVMNATHQIRFSVGGSLFIGILVVVAAFGFFRLYSVTAASGVLGEDAQYKFELQDGPLGVLVSGRGAEVLTATEAIRDSLIIGHGSWAKDEYYTRVLSAQLKALGYPPRPDKYGLIPTHSHLFGAWVEAGVLGAVFWVAVLLVAIRTLLMCYRHRDRLTALVVFAVAYIIWMVLFSPYGAEGRLVFPFCLSVVMGSLFRIESPTPKRSQTALPR